MATPLPPGRVPNFFNKYWGVFISTGGLVALVSSAVTAYYENQKLAHAVKKAQLQHLSLLLETQKEVGSCLVQATEFWKKEKAEIEAKGQHWDAAAATEVADKWAAKKKEGEAKNIDDCRYSVTHFWMKAYLMEDLGLLPATVLKKYPDKNRAIAALDVILPLDAANKRRYRQGKHPSDDMWDWMETTFGVKRSNVPLIELPKNPATGNSVPTPSQAKAAPK